MTKLLNAAIVAGLSTIGLILLTVVYFVATRLQSEILWTGRIILYTVSGAAILAVLAGIAWLWDFINDQRLNRQLGRENGRELNRRLRAEADRAELEAAHLFTTAPAGHQVYLTRRELGSITTPMHLAPGEVNGGKQLVTVSELNRWQLHQLAHNTAKLGSGQAAHPMIEGPAEALPPLLPVVVDAGRVILAGGSDSGKTTMIKWMISGRADHSAIVPIDPHAPSKILGYDVIGAGMDWPAIGQALESLVLLMTTRYRDVKDGVLGYGQHERISVFIDEWTAIVEYVPDAGEHLKALLIQSRKVNIHLTICAHSVTVDALGVDAQIRKSALVVELTGDKNTPRRAFVQPASRTTPDGKKARPAEHTLPGPFAGFVQPAGEVVKALPDAKVLRAQIMRDEGKSLTAIARAFFGVDRANGRQVNEVRELLDRATNARQGYDN